MVERHTLKSLHDRIVPLEGIATDIQKIKALVKYGGAAVLGSLVADGVIDGKWVTLLKMIFGAAGN